MSIEFWTVLWKVCLIASLAVFSVMAVLVSIGGAWDIRRLFQRLREQDAERPQDEEPGGPSDVE